MIPSLRRTKWKIYILATQTGGILGPFAWILGKILEFIMMVLLHLEYTTLVLYYPFYYCSKNVNASNDY